MEAREYRQTENLDSRFDLIIGDRAAARSTWPKINDSSRGRTIHHRSSAIAARLEVFVSGVAEKETRTRDDTRRPESRVALAARRCSLALALLHSRLYPPRES